MLGDAGHGLAGIIVSLQQNGRSNNGRECTGKQRCQDKNPAAS
jgi:hypothetical protein